MEDISDSEALHLVKMAKWSVWAKAMPFPDIGGKLQIPVEAEREKESFFVNINRGRTSSLKVTYQTRARTVIPLARLDVGASHQNPDGMHIGSPHLHIYREGFADKWAYELHSLPEHLAFAVINDNKNAPAVAASEALEEYGIRPLRWSERHDFADELAA